jgi:4-hydroxy-tetrahydrodipicolinate reductase
MKIALIGYGAMGQLIGSLASERGYQIVAAIDEDYADFDAGDLAVEIRGAKAAIDFSAAEAVRRNVEACLAAGIPIVEGTTGWNAELGAVEKLVDDEGGAMVYGANFSIGVNLFYKLAGFAAELFSRFPEYEVFIEEQHHSRKKDAPSGTAIRVREVIAEHFDREISVASTRAGSIPGTHRVGFDGPADQVLLQHLARSREGFASGAIMAAEWILGKKGCFEFSEILDAVARSRDR